MDGVWLVCADADADADTDTDASLFLFLTATSIAALNLLQCYIILYNINIV
jgi:hypothetical protein